MKTLDELADTFELLGDWDQRYQFLIEIGESLPAMPREYMTDANKVKECMSQVWVHAYWQDAARAGIAYHGDCDTSIIKGVLALLIQLCEGKTALEISGLDVDEFFERLGLDQHLSPNRHVGVYAIVRLMQKQAQALAAADRGHSRVPAGRETAPH